MYWQKSRSVKKLGCKRDSVITAGNGCRTWAGRFSTILFAFDAILINYHSFIGFVDLFWDDMYMPVSINNIKAGTLKSLL